MGEMLNDLIFSVNTILPVFIVVAIGLFYAAERNRR